MEVSSQDIDALIAQIVALTWEDPSFQLETLLQRPCQTRPTASGRPSYIYPKQHKITDL